ncbi:MAG: NusA-like transcription termination signal-binding factor [Candidatus Aenigmatarchaeota archaeon]
MVIKFDTESIRLMTIFENLTGVQVRDCLVEEDTVYFLVDEEKIGMAIGKNGSVVKNVEAAINKTIKLFGFSDDLTKFIKNLIPKAINIKIMNSEDGKKVEVVVEKSEKPLVIGREGKNLKIIKELLKRNYDVSELVVR